MNEWIPVTERMPEDYKDVLVCRSDHEIDIMSRYVYAPSNGIEEHGWDSVQEYSLPDNEDEEITVLAWMPLPEPYIPITETCLADKEKDTERKVQSK